MHVGDRCEREAKKLRNNKKEESLTSPPVPDLGEDLILEVLKLADAETLGGDDHANNGLKNMFGFFPIMVDVDLNKCEPWDLPDTACIGNKEWYFFNLRDRKYATGQRTNRAMVSGYWKAIGKDRQVVRKGTLVGMRKTVVFYQGRAPKGKKTECVMHEFRSESPGEQQSRLISSKMNPALMFHSMRSLVVKM